MAHRVLLCDDEIHICRAAEFKISRAGYDVRCACDGEDAWQQILDWQPEMLITDCQMPRLDGFGLCERIRNHEATRHLPILMLTAKGLELSRVDTSARWGVIAVLAKPFSPRELLRHVERVLPPSSAVVPAAATESIIAPNQNLPTRLV